MLESSPDSSAPTTTVKRYAPPNQRNRVLSRRKSGEQCGDVVEAKKFPDRFERTNSSYTNEGDKSQSSSRNIPILERGEAGSSNHLNEILRPGLISISGCCSSEAAQLLNDRWAAAMHSYNDPSIDLSERPVIYSGSNAPAWGPLRLPHQMDFVAELRRAIRTANSKADA
ncbi:PREDICTED: uncharacterized protein LOC104593378 isoform X2 [Nelumbo nucifera]|uniref:Uncharacterized protein LOC104593378 isoform X2 n=1 Tax=Nelumbo nucifera TaxID=4432 RepID=A0A1U7ZF21_NELNU|nr:PREDICTED: uncharacterized protein LOC104593378 isoform X2 [Nelumbo nucifera]